MNLARESAIVPPSPDPASDPELVLALAAAIEEDQLELHYQPQISLETGYPIGLEALVRWARPGIGLMAPDDFLPAIAAGGLMPRLTAWVLHSATRQLAEWQERAVVTHGFHVAVNISASEFANGHVVNEVRAALDASNLEPGDLVVELTESGRLEGNWGAIAEATRLRTMLDVDLSIDDFGKGWSSIALLHECGADELKIDRSFTQDLANPVCRTLVDAIVGIARNLNMRVVAEGIETHEHLQHAKDIGCDVGSGWLWGRGVPVSEVEAVLSGGSHLYEVAAGTGPPDPPGVTPLRPTAGGRAAA
jgi:EAL domain-containing protein (putative c-di-GMP-specific phosphodiesterase class I)